MPANNRTPYFFDIKICGADAARLDSGRTGQTTVSIPADRIASIVPGPGSGVYVLNTTDGRTFNWDLSADSGGTLAVHT
jgi:hypothetical protein